MFSEETLTGKRRLTSVAYLTFVTLTAEGQPVVVPPLALETEEDHQRAREAEERREVRLKARRR